MGKKGQPLQASHMYGAVLQWHAPGPLGIILHQETLDDAKVKVEDASRLWSTNENLLQRVFFIYLFINPVYSAEAKCPCYVAKGSGEVRSHKVSR